MSEGVTGYDAIVNPVVGKRIPKVGPVAVMAACGPDLKRLSGLLGFTPSDAKPFMISRLFLDRDRPDAAALIGPMIGAPYAAMLMESLIVRGARRIIFIGWCGALTPDLQIGDLVIPTSAFIDEGTSRHYLAHIAHTAPSGAIITAIDDALLAKQLEARKGAIWTTDAAFRETREKVTSFQEQGALAVDMETSALFAIAAFRQVEIGAVLVVSDSLAGDSWKPGFRAPEFKVGRKAACDLVNTLCPNLRPPK